MSKGMRKPLIGVVNPLREIPCFAIPIFGTYLFHIQSIDETDRISGFNELSISPDAITRVSLDEFAEIGGLAFYAFWFSPSVVIVGTKSELIEELRSRVDTLVDYPFIQCEVAEFIGDSELRSRALERISEIVEHENPGMRLRDEGESLWLEPISRKKVKRPKEPSGKAGEELDLYGIQMTQLMGNEPGLITLFRHLIDSQELEVFTNAFCEMLVDSRYDSEAVDKLSKALTESCRDKEESERVIDTVIDMLGDKGFNNKDVIDVRIGDVDSEQVAVVFGSGGVLTVAERNFFQRVFQRRSMRKPSHIGDIDSIRETVCEVQRSYDESMLLRAPTD